MANPVFGHLEKQWGAEANQQGSPTIDYDDRVSYDQRAFQQAQVAFQGPDADSTDTRRMTYDDVIVKTSLCLTVVIVSAAISWWVTAASPAAGMIMLFVGLLGGFGLAMFNIFAKNVRPGAVIAYSALEGLMLGALSQVTDAQIPGVVGQAVIATFAVFAVTLALFASGTVRNSPKMQRFVLISLIGLIASRLLIWVVSIFAPGVQGAMDQQIFGIPLAVFVSIFAVVVGAMALIGDFDQVQVGVRMGAPAKYSWASAFGIMVTLIWLYVEILNLLSRLNSRN